METYEILSVHIDKGSQNDEKPSSQITKSL